MATQKQQMGSILGRPVWIPLFLALCAVAVWGQNSAPTQTGKRATSTPYTGDLSVFDSPGRDERLHISRVMDTLGIAPGKGVADIGAGSGWFTVRAARRVGSLGTVYAVDINPEAIRYIDRRVHNKGLVRDRPQLQTVTVRGAVGDLCFGCLEKGPHRQPDDLFRSSQTLAQQGCSIV
jgi:SAM-dependent methyltransferase